MRSIEEDLMDIREYKSQSLVGSDSNDDEVIIALEPKYTRSETLREIEDAVQRLEDHEQITYVAVMGEFEGEKAWIIVLKREPEDLRRYGQRLAYRCKENIDTDSDSYLKIASGLETLSEKVEDNRRAWAVRFFYTCLNDISLVELPETELGIKITKNDTKKVDSLFDENPAESDKEDEYTGSSFEW